MGREWLNNVNEISTKKSTWKQLDGGGPKPVITETEILWHIEKDDLNQNKNNVWQENCWPCAHGNIYCQAVIG